MSKKTKNTMYSIIVLIVILIGGTGLDSLDKIFDGGSSALDADQKAQNSQEVIKEDASDATDTEDVKAEDSSVSVNGHDILSTVPKYSGHPYIAVNNGKPMFTKEELKKGANSFETYSELDNLGRCGVAFASVGKDTMPDEERGSIGMVKPSGWHTYRYDDIISDKYLYNRCHLIAFCLCGENANRQNLITGTRYLNVTGMLPFEEEILNYVRNTGNRVLYRVTPIFKGDDLVARGVLMEAQSIGNDDISFCVYCYNVQPGINIDYATGESEKA